MNEEFNLENFFHNVVKFINRNKKFLFIFIIINLILTCSYYAFIRPVQYRSVALCTSQIDKFEQQREFQRVAVDLINNLQIFIDAKDYQGLADVLSIEYEVAKAFASIQATQLYQLDMNEEYRNVHKFQIELSVFSNAHYEDIEKGILYYFNNNKYLVEISEAYMAAKLSVHNDIVKEIEALQKERGVTKSMGDFINTEFNSQDAINEIVFLAQKRESTLRDIKTTKVFSFIQGFNRLNTPQNDIVFWGFISFVISFFMGLLISLIREKI